MTRTRGQPCGPRSQPPGGVREGGSDGGRAGRLRLWGPMADSASLPRGRRLGEPAGVASLPALIRCTFVLYPWRRVSERAPGRPPLLEEREFCWARASGRKIEYPF